MINRTHLAQLRSVEDARFLALHPKSGALFEAGKKNMLATPPKASFPTIQSER